MQTNFHHDKRHGFIQSVKNYIFTDIFTCHSGCMLNCILLANGMTANHRCRTTYLPSVVRLPHILEMRSCSAPLTSNLHRPFCISRCEWHVHEPHCLMVGRRCRGSQGLCEHLTTLGRCMVLYEQLSVIPFATRYHYTNNGTICVK